MKTHDEIKSEKDTIVIAVVIGILLVAFILWYDFSFELRSTFLTWVLLCFIVGSRGRERKIGFGPAYFLSLLASPLIGFIFVMLSPNLKDEEYKAKMLDIATKNASGKVAGSIADELLKLNELRKEGALTEEEFHTQKEKLLSL